MKTKIFTLLFLAQGAGNVFAQPSNDDCANRITLTVNGGCSTVSTISANQSMPPILCNGYTSPTANDAWYNFGATAPSQTITVSTSDPNFDAVIELFTASICAGSSIQCADYTTGGQTETLNATGLTAGYAYFIRVYSYGSGSGGTFTICVTSSGGGNPDLITQNFTMSPNPVNAGSNLSVNFDVNNQGTVTANASTTRVRINQSSTTVLSSDPLIATFNTPALSAGASTTHSANYTVPTSYSGTYYVWVILDVNSTAGQGAANEANDKSNYSLSVIGISSNSDLITQNFSMSPNPVNAGSNISISFDVYNQGTGASSSCQTNVRINQSSSNVSGSDPLIASFTTPSLTVNASTTHNTNYTIPGSNSGTYYVWVILDVNSTAGQGAANEANDKSNYSLTVTQVVGIYESYISPQITIYPNPIASDFTLEIELLKPVEVEIKFLDLLERSVYSSLHETIAGKFSKEIHLNGSASGIYLIQVQIEEKSYSKKIVVH